ncbi:GPI transamidase component GPI17 [Yarrowia sp. C11]|nr:GPI transamidase component GPI17 [Yarrowia sp. E02]KAG5369532.1 GPI transamidase component GPI17 [Yarrowia sp. C11]
MVLIPKEPKEHVARRANILVAYILTFVLLGMPLWLYTTSVERSPLPHEDMAYYDGSVTSELHVKVPVIFSGVDSATASQIEAELAQQLASQNIYGWGIIPSTTEGVHIHIAEADSPTYTVEHQGQEIRITSPQKDLVKATVASILSVYRPEIQDFLRLVGREKSKDDLAVIYSPQYYITFSLFHGGGVPVSWDIQPALREYFDPLLNELQHVATFNVDTQVEHHAELSRKPEKVDNQYVLTPGDLSTFINSASWGLSSVHKDPTLHFILYVPDIEDLPMHIQGSESDSFVVPQWGGVKLINGQTHFSKEQLKPILETFSAQLLTLLGAPAQPASPAMRISALSRLFTVKALLISAQTLGSLSRLTKSLPSIAVPISTMNGVQKALEDLKTSIESLELGKNWKAVYFAAESMKKAQEGFFEKMMVQQMYFPDEHKVAVYLPLLGPIFVVILTGFGRVMRERKARLGEEEAVEEALKGLSEEERKTKKVTIVAGEVPI